MDHTDDKDYGDHGGNRKVKRILLIFIALFFGYVSGLLSLFSQAGTLPTKIRRLTFSHNNKVIYSSISASGQYVIYVLEKNSGDKIQKSVRLLHIDSGKESGIFVEGNNGVKKPYGEGSLLIGSKPPLVSADGKTAIFALSLGPPDNILDHFLAVLKPGKGDIKVLSFPNVGLKEKDISSLGFENPNWERISHYAISHDGSRVTCVLKGHLGPRRFGNCSGIVLLDLDSGTRRFLLGPDFIDESWKCSSFPCNPLLGGGWAFSMSGNGQKVLFGAQSSEEQTDFDLYIADWGSGRFMKITKFNDRWFSLADIGFDGSQVLFYYNGKKHRGIGTYRVNSDGSGLQYVESPFLPRIELYGISGDGSAIYYKNVYQGMMMSLNSGVEFIIFKEKTPGYVRGVSPMDFPKSPAFWTPKTISLNGSRLLLFGPPMGRQSPEIYLLSIDNLKLRQ